MWMICGVGRVTGCFTVVTSPLELSLVDLVGVYTSIPPLLSLVSLSWFPFSAIHTGRLHLKCQALFKQKSQKKITAHVELTF